MSLINQMLRDLESRRPQGAATSALGDLRPAQSPSPLSALQQVNWRRLTAIVSGFALLLGGYLWYARVNPFPPPLTLSVAPATTPAAVPPREETPQTAVTETATAQATAQPAAPEMDIPPHAEPPRTQEPASAVARIQSARISVMPDHTRLVLEATAPLTHHLATASGRVIIDLEHAALAQPLPMLDLRNSLITRIQAEPQGEHDLRITLNLKTPARAKSLVLGPEQDYGHRLVIDLYPEGVKDAAGLSALTGGATGTAAAPAKIKKPSAQGPSQRAERGYQEAVEALQNGKVAEAQQSLREALAQQPRHHPSRELLAETYLRNGQTGEAENLLVAGALLDPRYTLFSKLHARLLAQRGDISGALQILERHPAGAADDSEYHALLGTLYQRAADHGQAVIAYRTALRLEPGRGVWWMGLAISLEAQQNPDEALHAYRRAQGSGVLTGATLEFVQRKITRLEAPAS